MAIRTDRGLCAEFGCFILHTKGETEPVTSEISLSIQVPSDDGSLGPVSYVMVPGTSDPFNESKSWRQTKTHRILSAATNAPQRLHLLLGPSGIPGRLGLSDTGHVGLLVQASSQENGWIYAAPLDTVIVHDMPGGFKRVARDNGDDFVHWHAEENVDRQFCIG